jgi:hypothetical protein
VFVGQYGRRRTPGLSRAGGRPGWGQQRLPDGLTDQAQLMSGADQATSRLMTWTKDLLSSASWA